MAVMQGQGCKLPLKAKEEEEKQVVVDRLDARWLQSQGVSRSQTDRPANRQKEFNSAALTAVCSFL